MKFTKQLLLTAGILVLIFISVYYPFSMFTGQHTFVSGNNVNCARCHPDEAGNLSLSAYHSNLTCRTCHNVTFTPGEVAHAATIPECIQCHTNVTNHINNTYEAHMPFFRYANISDIRRGPNEACFMCHTNYSGNITFVYRKWLKFTITNMGTANEKISKTINNLNYYYMTFNYTISNVTRGPETTYTVQIKNQGGSTHYWKNISDISCVRCHKRIQLGNFGNAQGSQHAGDINDTLKWFDVPVQSHYHPGHANASYGGPTNPYCLSCHRNTSFDIFAANNPNLNSSAIHAALRLNCVVCHNSTGPYPPSWEAHFAGGHNSSMFFKEAQKMIPRKLMGSFCLACHRANNHAGLANMYQCSTCHGNCQSCHSNGVLSESTITNNLFFGSGNIKCSPFGTFPGGNITFNVSTEPWANVSSTWVNRSFSFYNST